MDEKKKKHLSSFVGKDDRHLITAVCDDKQLTVVIETATGITSYFLHRQDEGCHHHQR